MHADGGLLAFTMAWTQTWPLEHIHHRLPRKGKGDKKNAPPDETIKKKKNELKNRYQHDKISDGERLAVINSTADAGGVCRMDK